MSEEGYWKSCYQEERDLHTKRLTGLIELREQVSLAIEDIARNDIAAALDRLRRARVRSRITSTAQR